MVFLREVSLGPVRLQVFGAEHPHNALKLEAVQGKIECDASSSRGFPKMSWIAKIGTAVG